MAVTFETETFWTAWWLLLETLVIDGDHRAPRGLPTREHLGVVVRVEDGLDNILVHPIRNVNYQFMVAEWLWIMSGSQQLDELAQYNSKITAFSDDGKMLTGAYGPRLMPQMPWLLQKLQESDTRQAVATIWTPSPSPSRDIPCTVALQFLRRDSVINLIVTMRSSDIWLGLPYDFFTFSQILSCVCGALGCTVGFVQFQLGSSHLYESDLAKAEGVLNESTSGYSLVSLGSPGMPPEALLECMRAPSKALSDIELGAPAYRYSSPYWYPYVQVLVSGRKRSDALAYLTVASRP